MIKKAFDLTIGKWVDDDGTRIQEPPALFSQQFYGTQGDWNRNIFGIIDSAIADYLYSIGIKTITDEYGPNGDKALNFKMIIPYPLLQMVQHYRVFGFDNIEVVKVVSTSKDDNKIVIEGYNFGAHGAVPSSWKDIIEITVLNSNYSSEV